jgi:serine/threonine protein kinase
MENYVNKIIIGSGASGLVYYAEDIRNGRKVILKKILTENVKQKFLENFSREFKISKILKHKNLVEFIDAYQNDKYIILIYEYCDKGNLREYLKNIREEKDIQKKETMIKNILIQLKNALGYLREKNIVHRDLKPDNIVFKSENDDVILKLCDFGLSRIYDVTQDEFGNISQLHTFCGTLPYMAPEILLCHPYDGKSDLWSFGVILYEMMFNTFPFISKSIIGRRMNTDHRNINFYDNDERYNYSVECKDLLKSLLISNPDQRINWDNFFDHPWFDNRPLLSCVSTNNNVLIQMNNNNEIEMEQKNPTVKLKNNNYNIVIDIDDEWVLID